MKKRLAAIALLTLTGCGMVRQTTLPTRVDYSTPGEYLRARALDFLDVLPVSVAAGYGLSVQVRLTPLCGFGMGYTNNWRAGMGEDRFGPIWWEKERGIPILRYYRYQDYRDEPRRYAGGDPIYFEQEHRKRASTLLIIPALTRNGEIWFPVVPPYMIKTPWDVPSWSAANLLNAEAGIFLGAVGVRFAVSPFQLVDFILGIFSLDPAEDDPFRRAVQWPDPAASPSYDPDLEPAAEADVEATEETE